MSTSVTAITTSSVISVKRRRAKAALYSCIDSVMFNVIKTKLLWNSSLAEEIDLQTYIILAIQTMAASADKAS